MVQELAGNAECGACIHACPGIEHRYLFLTTSVFFFDHWFLPPPSIHRSEVRGLLPRRVRDGRRRRGHGERDRACSSYMFLFK